MIKLSDFGFEKKIKNPNSLFLNSFKSKNFILGKEVVNFENKFSEYCENEDCAAVGSCTSALQLSLLALGIGPGDEVITVPYTWISTVEAIRQVGATPVFVDINQKDFCINVAEIEKAISTRTKAIIAVDIFGHLCDYDELKKYKITIIEDAAQSTGGKYKKKRVGSIADITCFSFYPTKNLSCWGDAGAVVSNKTFIKEIKLLRNHGTAKKFEIKRIGWNSRMDAIHAEVLSNKIKYLDKWNQRRIEIANQYYKQLKNTCDMLEPNSYSHSVFHQFILKIKNNAFLKKKLMSKGVESRIYYPSPAHKIPVYATKDYLPNAEFASNNNLAIPVHQYLKGDEIKKIINNIKNFL